MSTVLVTGANRGLGLAFAQAYLRAGWDVLATIRGTLTGPLAKLAEANPDRLQIRQLDLDNSASIDALGAGLHGIAVDVFISNAALTGGEIGTFGQTDYERFEKCLRANTIAPLRLAERLADSVMISDRKIMFFLGSRLGAFPFFGYAGYMVSKSALNQVAMQAALALRECGVCVVAAHPGWVGTGATAAHGAAPLTPAQSAAMLMTIIDGLTIDSTGKFFDPDGSELPLVTQQKEPKFYGKPSNATR